MHQKGDNYRMIIESLELKSKTKKVKVLQKREQRHRKGKPKESPEHRKIKLYKREVFYDI